MVNIVLNLQLQETCSFPSLDNNRLNVQMKIEKKTNSFDISTFTTFRIVYNASRTPSLNYGLLLQSYKMALVLAQQPFA